MRHAGGLGFCGKEGVVVCLLVGAGLVCEGRALAQQVIYVDGEASGCGGGGSWGDAYVRLQDALSDAASRAESSPVQVWVAAGVYYPHDADGDVSLSFELHDNVAIFGGFAGGETSLDQRDWSTNQTVLDGDLLGNDDPTFVSDNPCCTADTAEECGDAACVETVCELSWRCHESDFEDYAWPYCCDICRTPYCDNATHVVQATGVDETAVLDGFIVTGGSAYDYTRAPYGGSAGGMLIRDGSPTVRNCLFTGNQAKRELNVLAGGLEGDPTFISCQFADSSNGRGVTSSVGGGFVQRSMGAVTFIDCAFTGNDRGGAVVLGQQASFYDCRFAHNIAGFGGGLHIDCPTMCVGCVFEYNQGRYGGGIRIHDSAILVNCVVRSNTATDNGGAISVLFGNLAAENCVIVGNRSADPYANGNVTLSYSGGSLINCTVADNMLDYSRTAGVWHNGSLTIKNTIVHGNRTPNGIWPHSQVASDSEGTLSMTHSLVVDWDPEDGGEAMITEDPQFVRPGEWDDAGTPDDWTDDIYLEGDYHLLPGSPAINAGDPSINWHPWASDLDGHPQELCGEADIGAYEFGIGDADCDQVVTRYDSAFWEYCLTGPPQDDDPWDTEPVLSMGCKALDFDSNNHVDLTDFAQYAARGR